MKTICITGVNGFIGSEIAARLLDLGREVIGIDTHNGNIAPLAIRPGFHFFRADITKPSSFPSALLKVESVVHCAALVHGAAHDLSQENYFAVNAEGTRRVFEFLITGALRHFIFLSSVCVYGALPQIVVPDESTPPEPEDAYGKSKLAAEHLLRDASERTGIPATILRLTPVYGRRFLLNLRKRVVLPGNLGFYKIVGGGHRCLSLCAVQNVADVVVDALGSPPFFGQTYIVKDELDYRSDDIIRAFRSLPKLERKAVFPIPAVFPKLVMAGLKRIASRRGRYWAYKIGKVLHDAIFSGDKLQQQGVIMKWDLEATLKNT